MLRRSYGPIDGVHVKRKNHERYVRFCNSDDSFRVTDGMLELHHSRICLFLVAVESGNFENIDLNCNKTLSLGISHINQPGRSKRMVHRCSRPHEHCHLSSLQH